MAADRRVRAAQVVQSLVDLASRVGARSLDYWTPRSVDALTEAVFAIEEALAESAPIGDRIEGRPYR
jgi:hypothetical protein